MNRSNHIVLLAFCSIVRVGYGQELCFTDEVHAFSMETDTAYRNAFIRNDSELREFLSHRGGDDDSVRYTIPVVVHVIHIGEEVGVGSNISDDQIHGAILGLNQRFKGQLGSGGDMGIDFCLAVKDPQGCPTNGIMRVDGSTVDNYVDLGISYDHQCGAFQFVIKDLSSWPVSKYYNIWVVHKICGPGVGGFASYPNGGQYDGTVLLSQTMTLGNRTLAHELGHGLNLRHTWQGDGPNGDQCPNNTNCLWDGDQVCDTPPHKRTNCGEVNPCSATGVWDNSRYNYMSYCHAAHYSHQRFSPGQRERMRATLQVPPRLSLLSSNGCQVDEVSIIGTLSTNPCPVTILTIQGEYASVQWNTGQTSPSITVFPATTTTYSVVATTACGVTMNASYTLERELEMSEIEGDAVHCAGMPVEYSIAPQPSVLQYNWYYDGALIGSGHSIVLEPAINGILKVALITNCHTLNIERSIELVQHETPQITAVGDELVSSYATGNQWFLDGEPLPDGIGQSLGDPLPGTYTVAHTDQNGCTVVSEPYFHFTTNVAGYVAPELVTVFPNPTTGAVAISLARGDRSVQVTLYDAAGRTILSDILNATEGLQEIHMEGLRSGIYLLEAANDRDRQVLKVVVH